MKNVFLINIQIKDSMCFENNLTPNDTNQNIKTLPPILSDQESVPRVMFDQKRNLIFPGSYKFQIYVK